MTNKHNRRMTARDVSIALVAFLAVAVAIMWTWNTLGHDLFGGPEARYQHGLAAAMALGLLQFVVGRRRNHAERHGTSS